MEYQKIMNLLDNASNQPSKFRTRNWLEINDESRGTYSGNEIKFKLQCSGLIYVIMQIHTYYNNYWGWS